MKELKDFKLETIPHYQIVFALTSEPDYEMKRAILVELYYDEFILITGWHCSCYGFDETQWTATEYDRDELIAVMRGWQKSYDIEVKMAELVLGYLL